MAVRMKDSAFFLGMKKAANPKEFLQYLRDRVRERATLELGGGSTIKYDDYVDGYDIFNYITPSKMVLQKMRIKRENLDSETLKDDLSNIDAEVTVDEACSIWQKVTQAGGRRRIKKVSRNRRQKRRSSRRN